MMHALQRSAVFIVAVILLFASTAPVFAQEALSVTVTPPLFQLTIGPGETWSSSVKVVNNNAYDMSYTAQVVDFEANGEAGQGTFVPLIESFADNPTSGSSLGSWIEISKQPVDIKAGQSASIEFTVHVPQNADPGGHYAAIMVGPYEGQDTDTGSHMKISSFVTSLLLVRIKGEIIESGRIREFTPERTLYQKPEARFSLRFENTGNTHLRPQGSIAIYNMYGKERGEVLINEKSNFGNVLPRSIRKFEFSWAGESNVFDIGRYSAVVTLGYGEDGKQNTFATTYFWVIPVVPAGITFGTLIIVVLLMTWFIRRYVRRALSLERAHLGVGSHPDVPNRMPVEHVSTLQALVQPIKEGVVDLRNMSAKPAPAMRLETPDYVEVLTPVGFFSKYKLFFVFLVLLVVMIVGIWLYFDNVLVPQRSFNIEEIPQGATTTPVL